MLRADKIGIFTPLRGLTPKTAELLRSYHQFTFPSHHFSGTNTDGSVLAITVDCLKKTPVSVVMATGEVNGQTREFLIATAAPGKPPKEIVIQELDGVENVVAQVRGLTVIDQTPSGENSPCYLVAKCSVS